MAKIDLGVALCFVAAALLSSCKSPVAGPDDESGTVVQFSYDKVDPETVHIGADGSVVWENIAQDTHGFIVFPVSIAKSFRCSDLGPTFSRTLNDYRSLPIGGMQGDRVGLPCALAPGSYDYEVWIVGAGFGDEIAGDPQVLHATIVVE